MGVAEAEGLVVEIVLQRNDDELELPFVCTRADVLGDASDLKRMRPKAEGAWRG